MPDRRRPDPPPLDPLEEAIVFAMQRAAVRRRDETARRAKMRLIQREGGRAA